MNEPHDKICPECGSYMDWREDHYECPECGHIGRKMWIWQKIVTVLTIITVITVAFYQFILT